MENPTLPLKKDRHGAERQGTRLVEKLGEKGRQTEKRRKLFHKKPKVIHSLLWKNRFFPLKRENKKEIKEIFHREKSVENHGEKPVEKRYA